MSLNARGNRIRLTGSGLVWKLQSAVQGAVLYSGVGTTRNRTSRQAVIEERILMEENILAGLELKGENQEERTFFVCFVWGAYQRDSRQVNATGGWWDIKKVNLLLGDDP